MRLATSRRCVRCLQTCGVGRTSSPSRPATAAQRNSRDVPTPKVRHQTAADALLLHRGAPPRRAGRGAAVAGVAREEHADARRRAGGVPERGGGAAGLRVPARCAPARAGCSAASTRWARARRSSGRSSAGSAASSSCSTSSCTARARRCSSSASTRPWSRCTATAASSAERPRTTPSSSTSMDTACRRPLCSVRSGEP